MLCGLSEVSSITTDDSTGITGSNVSTPCRILVPQYENYSDTYATLVLRPLPTHYENLTRTIYVCGGALDLTKLSSIIGDQHLLNLTSKKQWFLNANIWLLKGSTLFINSTDTNWLKINSTGGTAYSIVVKGKSNLVIDHTKISSWDSRSNTEAKLGSGTKPRAYLLIRWDGGQMNITNSDLSSLGYITRDRYGDIMGNKTGIAYFSGAGSILKNNTISFNYRGFYSSNVSSITLQNNTIHNNYEYGLDPHTGSRNLKIIGNNIYNNGHHGIICSKNCNNVIVEENLSYNNSGHGIMLDQLVVNSTVTNNKVYNNKYSGIAIWNSSGDTVRDNLIFDNHYGLIVSSKSHNNIFKNNNIWNSISNGIYLYSNSSNNIFEGNSIINSSNNGIYINDFGTSP